MGNLRFRYCTQCVQRIPAVYKLTNTQALFFNKKQKTKKHSLSIAYRELATGAAHRMQTPAAENPAFWGLIKPTAKQGRREWNEAGGMSKVRGMDGCAPYRKETRSRKAFQDILLLYQTLQPQHVCTSGRPAVCVCVCKMHPFYRKHIQPMTLFLTANAIKGNRQAEISLTGMRSNSFLRFLVTLGGKPEAASLFSTA